MPDSSEGPNVHNVVLSSVHLRSVNFQLARWENDLSLVSHSVMVHGHGVNGSVN